MSKIDLCKGDCYRLCLRHMGKDDNCFLFWGNNNSGYYRSIEDAGLYESNESSKDDPIVPIEIINKHKQKIVLPTYGDNEEKYAGRNSFYVLPNTGQVRKELGITLLDIHLDGNRNSFNAYFKDTIYETFKYSYSKTHFNIKGKKEHFNEWWYCDIDIEADNRNQAINKVFKGGEFGQYHDTSFIEFKNMVTCSRTKTKVLDKWKKIQQ